MENGRSRSTTHTPLVHTHKHRRFRFKKKFTQTHEKRTSPIVERMRLCYLVLLLNARPIASIFFAFFRSHRFFFFVFLHTEKEMLVFIAALCLVDLVDVVV